jgi:hypothetical protein
MGKLSKLFEMILQGHEQASGITCPSKQISVGYQTHLHKFMTLTGRTGTKMDTDTDMGQG